MVECINLAEIKNTPIDELKEVVNTLRVQLKSLNTPELFDLIEGLHDNHIDFFIESGLMQDIIGMHQISWVLTYDHRILNTKPEFRQYLEINFQHVRDRFLLESPLVEYQQIPEQLLAFNLNYNDVINLFKYSSLSNEEVNSKMKYLFALINMDEELSYLIQNLMIDFDLTHAASFDAKQLVLNSKNIKQLKTLIEKGLSKNNLNWRDKKYISKHIEKDFTSSYFIDTNTLNTCGKYDLIGEGIYHSLKSDVGYNIFDMGLHSKEELYDLSKLSVKPTNGSVSKTFGYLNIKEDIKTFLETITYNEKEDICKASDTIYEIIHGATHEFGIKFLTIGIRANFEEHQIDFEEYRFHVDAAGDQYVAFIAPIVGKRTLFYNFKKDLEFSDVRNEFVQNDLCTYNEGSLENLNRTWINTLFVEQAQDGQASVHNRCIDKGVAGIHSAPTLSEGDYRIGVFISGDSTPWNEMLENNEF